MSRARSRLLQLSPQKNTLDSFGVATDAPHLGKVYILRPLAPSAQLFASTRPIEPPPRTGADVRCERLARLCTYLEALARDPSFV